MAHITGGGITETCRDPYPRHGRSDRLTRDSAAGVHVPEEDRQLDDMEMLRTFNMGMVISSSCPREKEKAIDVLRKHAKSQSIARLFLEERRKYVGSLRYAQ
jgi:phosphoribosylaminoimidazole (AIR) synthetase